MSTKRGQSHLILLLLANSPLASLPRLVQGLRTSCLIVFGQTIGNQDLLSSYPDIVLKHGVFVCSPEQVIHHCRWLLCKRLKNGVPEHQICLKIYMMASILQDSTGSTTCPNRFMKSLSNLFSYNSIFCKVLMFYLWPIEHKQWPMKAFHISRKAFTKFCWRQQNQERAWSCRLTRKTLHNSASFPISRVMRCLKCMM